MRKVNRREMVIGLAAVSMMAPVAMTPSVAAQGAIPDGVFVQESNGKVWLTLKGQRVAVPIWQAGDADIAAVTDSGMWAVLSVNDAGAIVAGGRPAWHTDAAPPARAAQPSAVVAPAAQPTTDGTLVITEHVSYKTRFGGDQTFVVGMIENTGSGPLGVKTIAVSLLGADGGTVGGGSAVYKPRMLGAGMRAPWLATISNASSFSDIRIQAESGPAQSQFDAITHELKLEGITAQPRRNVAGPKIVGQVVNVGGQTIGRAPVIGAVFTTDGKLLDVNQAYTKLEKFAPGQSSPFEIDFIREDVRDPSNYELYVEGRPER